MKEFRLEIAEDMINELLECDALNIGGTIFIKKSVVVKMVANFAKKKKLMSSTETQPSLSEGNAIER